ncbi:MAG: hypothetical protein PHT96_00835 [Syntrophorhabdaceae bacterium]|nr:hypothetical protein [Syntrophorhabdaceae bacterium]MDD4194940.1 hypothetical protein [Syntrophorhabdaceae bacterium]
MDEKNIIVLYIISALIIIGGFVMIFMTRSTSVLAAGAVLIIIGLFVFLFGREKSSRARAA